MAYPLLLRRSLVTLNLCASAPLIDCHRSPSEPGNATATTGAPSAAPSGAPPGEPRHQTHRIIEADHRHIVPLAVDDRIASPLDPAFDWRIEVEKRQAFAPVVGDGLDGTVLRVTQPGPLRIMVFGDPKCLKADAGCTLSKRRWDITLDVR